jgi:ADP-heptose:LPS heptosyltransferase
MQILIIKLGAKGDVVRTLPLLLAIKEKFPESIITWITKSQCKEILETSPHIDNILTIPANFETLTKEFDILYNFDIEEDATNLANKIKANKKYGFGSENGYATAFNFPAEYYLSTLFDDELKKSNTKTYQQIMFETAELHYNKQHHSLNLTNQEKQYAENFLAQNNINKDKLIGIHIGASPRWPSKTWHKDNLKEFIKKAQEENYEIIIFGGPDEIQEHETLAKEFQEQGIKIHRNNPNNTDKEFFSLINACNKIIAGDTFALHVALALKKQTIGLFFCTSSKEVEDYNLLKKLTSPRLYEFFPEKCDQYDEDLTKSISAQEVLDAIEE